MDGRALLTAAGRRWGELGEREDILDETPPDRPSLGDGWTWEAGAAIACILAVCLAPSQGAIRRG